MNRVCPHQGAWWMVGMVIGILGLCLPGPCCAADGQHGFDGKYGFTAVFAFSTETGKHGWGFAPTKQLAAARALRECGKGAQLVAFQADGYLALVWDGTAYAFGHSQDDPQEALDHAIESFMQAHGGNAPTGKKAVRSDGKMYKIE